MTRRARGYPPKTWPKSEDIGEPLDGCEPEDILAGVEAAIAAGAWHVVEDGKTRTGNASMWLVPVQSPINGRASEGEDGE